MISRTRGGSRAARLSAEAKGGPAFGGAAFLASWDRAGLHVLHELHELRVVVGHHDDTRARRHVHRADVDPRVRDLTRHHAHRAGGFGALHRGTEDRVGLTLHLDARALERLARPGPVLDADVDDAAALEADADQALDVDPGLAERLADTGEAPRTVLDGDGEIGRHAVSFPKGSGTAYARSVGSVKSGPRPGRTRAGIPRIGPVARCGRV